MRLPKDKIYRAFPELDQFSNEQCERFVYRAGRGRTSIAHRLVLLAMTGLIVVILIPLELGFVVVCDNYLYSFFEGNNNMLPAFFLALFMGVWLLLDFLCLLIIRDKLMIRRIRQVLAKSSQCHSCGYSLLGLPVSSLSSIQCPECGHITIVDLSLNELHLDEKTRALQSSS